MTLPDNHLSELQAIALVSSCLGALGALASILSYIFISRFRTPLSRTIAMTSVTDLISAIFKAYGLYASTLGGDSPECQAQAAVVTMGDTAALIWHLTFAFSLYRMVMGNSVVISSRKWHLRSTVLACVVPFLLAFPLVFLRPHGIPVYGVAGLWCWVRMNHPWIQLAILHIPLWIVFFLDFGIFIYIGRYVHKQSKGSRGEGKTRRVSRDHLMRYGLRASVFLLAFIILWLPNTMNRLHIIIHQGKSPQVTLAYLRIALSPARGLINFFLFALLSLSTSPKPTSSAAATAIYTQGEIESRERARDSAATLRHDFPVWSGTPIYQPHVLGDGLGKSMEDGDAHSTSETILASPCADSRRLSIPPTVHYWDGKPSDLEQDKGGKL